MERSLPSSGFQVFSKPSNLSKIMRLFLFSYFTLFPTIPLQKDPLKKQSVTWSKSENTMCLRKVKTLSKQNTENNWPPPTTPFFWQESGCHTGQSPACRGAVGDARNLGGACREGHTPKQLFFVSGHKLPPHPHTTDLLIPEAPDDPCAPSPSSVPL